MKTHTDKPGKMDRGVIVPVDFSAIGEHAMLHGLDIARAMGCPLVLLHVDQTGQDTILNGNGDAGKKHRELKNYREKYGPAFSVDIHPLVRKGNLFRVFSSVTAETRPHVMVMGTHGKQGLQHLYGSYALRVVLDAICPVMVVQSPPCARGYKKIMLPVSRDTDPETMIQWILILGGITPAEVHLFIAAADQPETERATSALAAGITGMLDRHQVMFITQRADPGTEFSEQVIGYAGKTGMDLVITMTMPATGATGFGFSEWNERLMFNPDRVPVLFIPGTEKTR